MWTKQTAEMRHSPRVDAGQMVVALPDGYHFVRANLSTGGVGFELDDAVPPRTGDPITVQLRIPELKETVAVRATVRHVHRARHCFYVGAGFENLDLLVENPIFRYVEETALLFCAPERSGAHALA